MSQFAPINKLKASMNVVNNSALNVSYQNLGDKGISVNYKGDIAKMIPMAYGAVVSPEPYMIGEAEFDIAKTAPLGGQWKAQVELNSVIGDIVLYPDTSAYPTQTWRNCSITEIKTATFNGTEAVIGFTVSGTYYINSFLTQLQ